MKTFTSIISILLLSQNAFAVVYRTITNGLMEDASVWVPALPPYPLPSGDTIIIQNIVDMNSDCDIEGVLIINSGCSLESINDRLYIESGGKVIVNGILKIKNVENDGLLTNNGRIEIHGNFNNNGAGSFIDGTNGVFRLTNNTLNNAGGNISGTLDFCRLDEVTNPLVSNSGTVDWSTVSICGAPPLPVKIIDFIAKEENEKIIIEWATTEEINNSHFELEKSLDANQFSVFAIVDAAANYNGVNNYKAYDADNGYEEIYYRLKQVDIDGRYEYSKVISIKTDNKFDMSIYPNPVDNNTGVMCRISDEEKGELVIVIIDQCGQENFHKTLMANGDFLSKSGIYFVLAIQGDKSYRKKLVVR